ncbi:MAG: hypothetical protein GF317_05800 [Candidatus Lokiarchaeota archaeon]|nr:hypothetical protein [Candidatus Lokiarchaeota archaeon]
MDKDRRIKIGGPISRREFDGFEPSKTDLESVCFPKYLYPNLIHSFW